MSNLKQMINDDVKQVYVVKIDSSEIKVFASLESARSYILREIGEFKEGFLTSSWHLEVIDDAYNFLIKCKRWFFGVFYYESVLKTFEISEQIIRE